eukprot:766991-Hanusia_phi.AAC.2
MEGMMSTDLEASLRDKFKSLQKTEECSKSHGRSPNAGVYDALRKPTGFTSDLTTNRAILELKGVIQGQGSKAAVQPAMRLKLNPPVHIAITTAAKLEVGSPPPFLSGFKNDPQASERALRKSKDQSQKETSEEQWKDGQKESKEGGKDESQQRADPMSSPLGDIPLAGANHAVRWQSLVLPADFKYTREETSPLSTTAIQVILFSNRFSSAHRRLPVSGIQIHSVPVESATQILQVLQDLRQTLVLNELVVSCFKEVEQVDEDAEGDEENQCVNSAADGAEQIEQQDAEMKEARPDKSDQLVEDCLMLLCIEIRVSAGGEVAVKMHPPPGLPATCTDAYATEVLRSVSRLLCQDFLFSLFSLAFPCPLPMDLRALLLHPPLPHLSSRSACDSSVLV